MKKQATSKQSLKQEVNDLLNRSEPRILKHVTVILNYNERFKVDHYAISGNSEYDEHKNFSMDSLTEEEAKTLLENPDTILIVFQRENSSHADWLKKACCIEVVINDIDLIDVEKFFNFEYTPLVFPQYKISDGHYNYWDHINDPELKWWGSEGRKLWYRVTHLWMKTLEDRLEKATGKPVFHASKLYMY